MVDFEKLGVFYIGRLFDIETGNPKNELLLYDSKDLVTHGLCVGMTGSGKTGLCIDFLEEAAIDGIPTIAIDPKGDLTNILLTFPELKPEDFFPWVNEDDARKKGLSIEEYAKEEAIKWQKGLEEWGQSKERIKKFREAVDLIIFTPGSNAGIPVSIIKSFSSPQKEVMEDSEIFNERITTTVSSLLDLIKRDSDPVKSRDHILISKIFDHFWKNGMDLDLSNLIQQIQNPPFKKIGVMDVESFYPMKERFELAVALNNLIASPSFNLWFEGVPLEIKNILYSPNGKPRISIFYIAHLNDKERMFFVSLLLNQIVSWMRSLSGTTSLRAIVYMDEIFGYFPPVENPPSKIPLLTLLKQGRAFGIGILLSTQNPVDLDYKGLSNIGTWLIGRLQTERDKLRVLDGLEGAMATSEKKFNRKEIDKILSSLGKRVFYMNNIHEDEPVIFESRWAMSYLRGPLTRDQVKKLIDPIRDHILEKSGSIFEEKVKPTVKEEILTKKEEIYSEKQILPPTIQQFFVPLKGSIPENTTLIYFPMLLGFASIGYSDSKLGIYHVQEKGYITSFVDSPIPIEWEKSKEIDFKISDLQKEAYPNAKFANLPVVATNPKNYDNWSKNFLNFIFRNETLELFRSPTFKEVSKPNESELDFKLRVKTLSFEERDKLLEKVREKYGTKIKSLQEKIRKAEQVMERETEQAKLQKTQTAISVGATILGAILGRKTSGLGTVGRATTAARSASRILKEQEDIKRAQESLEVYKKELQEIEKEFQLELDKITQNIDSLTENIEKITLKPAKKDIIIKLFALVWLPYIKDISGNLNPYW